MLAVLLLGALKLSCIGLELWSVLTVSALTGIGAPGPELVTLAVVLQAAAAPAVAALSVDSGCVLCFAFKASRLESVGVLPLDTQDLFLADLTAAVVLTADTVTAGATHGTFSKALTVELEALRIAAVAAIFVAVLLFLGLRENWLI